jgi:hypothetical protein
MESLAPPNPAFKGKPLPSSPRPHKPGPNPKRDIVSTILNTYGGDPGIEFSPSPVGFDEKLLPANPFSDDQAFSRTRHEPSPLSDMDDGYDPYRQEAPLRPQGSNNDAEQMLGTKVDALSDSRPEIQTAVKKPKVTGLRKRTDSAMEKSECIPSVLSSPCLAELLCESWLPNASSSGRLHRWPDRPGCELVDDGKLPLPLTPIPLQHSVPSFRH